MAGLLQLGLKKWYNLQRFTLIIILQAVEFGNTAFSAFGFFSLPFFVITEKGIDEETIVVETPFKEEENCFTPHVRFLLGDHGQIEENHYHNEKYAYKLLFQCISP